MFKSWVLVLCAVCAVGQVKIRQNAQLLASDGKQGSTLGMSMAVSGNYIVADAIDGVYVYALNSKGTVTQLAKLTATNGDYLGGRVAIGNAGAVVVVGAQTADERQGAAYVFTMPPGGWADTHETARLKASDAGKHTTHDNFGGSIAINSNVIVIGASQYINQNDWTGEAYVFVKPAQGWVSGTETTILNASNGKIDDIFGSSVAIFGPRIVVGAPGINHAPGQVYVFQEPVGGWRQGIQTETAILTAPDATHQIGGNIAVYQKTVAIGASSTCQRNACSAESLYLYTQPPQGWVSTSAPNVILTDTFDSQFAVDGQLAMDDKMIATSNPGATWGVHFLHRGIVYAFLTPQGGWTKNQNGGAVSIKTSNGLFSGDGLAVAKTKLYIGAPGTVVNGQDRQGEAYIVTLTPQ